VSESRLVRATHNTSDTSDTSVYLVDEVAFVIDCRNLAVWVDAQIRLLPLFALLQVDKELLDVDARGECKVVHDP